MPVSETHAPTFLAAVAAAARARPDAPAVDDLSYGVLWRAAGRAARAFAARGVTRGDRVVVFSENRVGFVVAYLGAQRLGAIAVPANVLYRSADLGHLLDDADPRLVVVSAATAGFVGGERDTLAIESLEALAHANDDEHDVPDPCLSPDDPAVLVYTSGTTGRSKGAILTQGNIAAIARGLGAAWAWTPDDRLLLTLPLFHVHGLGAGLSTALAAGAHVTIRERFDANDVAERLRSGKHTLFFGVPTMYARLLEKAEPGAFPAVRLFVSGSAALPATVHEAFGRTFGATILERYGSTEFGFPLSNAYHGRRIPGSVGLPVPDARVAIVEPGTTTRVAAGETGELLVAGPTVTPGYWRRPDITDVFVELDGERYFRSGDLARFDLTHEAYVIAGRIKELIISGGFNVYPLEVEAAMRAAAHVRDAALVGWDDAARGEIPVAFLEVEPGFSEAAFLATLRREIASFKIPKVVNVVDALPRNALGKVEKQKLKALQPAS
jgi:malonyl-CoA/methylmalonyl-CoA synthetase